MNAWVKSLPYLLILALILAFSVSVNTCTRIKQEKQYIEAEKRIDTITIVVRDTVFIKEPKYITKRIVDTVVIKVSDTINNIVYIPIEQKEYRSDDYQAWVSGYEPKLDSINIFKKNEIKYITQTIRDTGVIKKKRPFGIGIQIGYGLNKNAELTPYIGVGMSYNIITF